MPAPITRNKKENIILVDPEDKEIGTVEKILGHQYAMLHRAFSVLIFRKRAENIETLLQQRSIKKYHGGGLWTNTCCSHPAPGEQIVSSAEKRVLFEMGINVKLREVGKFHYVALLDHGLVENEIDHVLIGTYDADVIPINLEEVDDYAWKEVTALQQNLLADKEQYTPWFKQALDLALLYYK